VSEHMLPLGEVLQGLREEIVTAMHSAEDQPVKFELGPIDLEFTVVAKREGGPNGKVKFEVFGFGAELGGDAKFSNEKTQKVKLTLSPVDALIGGKVLAIRNFGPLPGKGTRKAGGRKR